MNLAARRRPRPAINIVPLVDVLTVLLFFFLVTMQFKQLSALNITAPEIETAGENKLNEAIVIAIDEAGTLYLNDREVSEKELRSAMRLAGDARPETPVRLIADEGAPIKHVTRVMDICRANQLNAIRLQSR